MPTEKETKEQLKEVKKRVKELSSSLKNARVHEKYLAEVLKDYDTKVFCSELATCTTQVLISKIIKGETWKEAGFKDFASARHATVRHIKISDWKGELWFCSLLPDELKKKRVFTVRISDEKSIRSVRVVPASHSIAILKD